MAAWQGWLLLTIQTAVAGGIILLVPRITRRGLLFGVYVGEAHWHSERAEAITRQWYRSMIGAVAVSVVLGIVLGLVAPETRLGRLAPMLIVLAASLANYVRAYRAASTMAVPGAPVATAVLTPDVRGDLTIPVVATSIAVCIGLAAVADAWLAWAEMPARVPTHFGPSGAPDAWRPKSIGNVMMLPVMALVTALFVGGLACVSARAKRGLRQADGGVSYDAQIRFRRAVSNYLSGTAVLTAILLGGLSYGSVRVALGRADGLPVWAMAAGVLLLVYGLGGTIWLMLRYGQGGARLEKAAERSPLTNGLADNGPWVWGMFYVNRDDPSWLVEKRFGFGYTVNFGNPKAVGLLVAFVVCMMAMGLVAGR